MNTTSINNDCLLTATDKLADSLAARKRKSELTRNASSAELIDWWEVKQEKKHIGNCYHCGKCGEPALLKKKPRGGFYVAHSPNSTDKPECPRARRTSTAGVLDLKNLEQEFFIAPSLSTSRVSSSPPRT